MSEAIYYLKSGIVQARWKIKGLLTDSDDIKILGPAHCSMDLIEMTPEDIDNFVDVIREMKEFKSVVIDVGFYSEAMLELCSRGDSIHLVNAGGEEYEQATDYFIAQLKIMQHDEIEGRLEVVEYSGGACQTGKRGTNRAFGLLAGVE